MKPVCAFATVREGNHVNQSRAEIIRANSDALSVVASAARMSTQPGTALEVFARAGNPEKDLGLVAKVLASGHKSVVEHQTVSVAFNDVSVMVEQFVIEFRLASFTVKSRRYVDFSGAGFVVPALESAAEARYRAGMEARFQAYSALLELGIPKEDARFVLPYCLRSNFFMTLDARELIHMIAAMLGRGARFAELKSLGEQLKAQFDALYPGAVDAELAQRPPCAEAPLASDFRDGTDASGDVELIDAPRDASATLERALAFSRRFPARGGRYVCPENVRALLVDGRPRELEALAYTLRVRNLSLACLTHFTRHRMQSPQIPCVLDALARGDYVLPASVAANREAEAIYRGAFAAQAALARELRGAGVPPQALAYCAMSGHVLDMMTTVNARELLHFAKLRTCARAQWEIRGIARKMLARLNESAPEIFGGYGPSCAVTGVCPEGRMSCGHPVRVAGGVWTRADGSEEEGQA